MAPYGIAEIADINNLMTKKHPNFYTHNKINLLLIEHIKVKLSL
jgi:hypothetical protein